jgi:hypothetical protein
MKRTVDDLPMIKASAMVVAGLIGRETRSAVVQFGDVGYVVGVKTHHFRKCGGWWALFLCPRCGGGAQRLRLLDDRPACGACVRGAGLRYRTEMVPHSSQRAALTAARRIERLNSTVPERITPSRLTGIEHRASVEAKLRRSLIVARRHALDEHDERLEKLMGNKTK